MNIESVLEIYKYMDANGYYLLNIDRIAEDFFDANIIKAKDRYAMLSGDVCNQLKYNPGNQSRAELFIISLFMVHGEIDSREEAFDAFAGYMNKLNVTAALSNGGVYYHNGVLYANNDESHIDFVDKEYTEWLTLSMRARLKEILIRITNIEGYKYTKTVQKYLTDQDRFDEISERMFNNMTFDELRMLWMLLDNIFDEEVANIPIFDLDDLLEAEKEKSTEKKEGTGE